MLKISASTIRPTKELNTINACVHCAVPLESQYTSFPVGVLKDARATEVGAGDGYTGLCKKVPAKFGEESSVQADGLCIGCLGLWAEVRRENSNMQKFFRTILYMYLF